MPGRRVSSPCPVVRRVLPRPHAPFNREYETLRALDSNLDLEPPSARLRLDGVEYRLLRVLKQDTWAASYLIERADDGSWHVMKVARFRWRRFPGLSIPLPAQTDHEVALYRRLAGLEGIPDLTGRPRRHAFLHAWIPGREIGPAVTLPGVFFAELEELLGQVHHRGIAYVDLEKDENVLVGDDGHPYLIDFQISLARPRWLVRVFQAEDERHLLKHRKNLAPATVTEADRNRVHDRSWLLTWHRKLTRPYFAIRRKIQGR